MSKSFYWGSDPKLASGVTNFSTRISATPTAYGLTTTQASTYATAAAAWASAYELATTPATRTKSSVAAKDDARRVIQDATKKLVKFIDAAAITNAQRIDLGLAPIVTPSWPGNPGTPSDLKATLNGLGGLDLAWKCKNPTSGTMYAIYRKIGDAEPTYIGGSGNKKFEDNNLPATLGTTVTYQIQAQRNTGSSGWATFVVNIGTSPSGTAVQSVVPSTVKIAA